MVENNELKEDEQDKKTNFFDSLIQAKEDGDSLIIDKKKNSELSEAKSTYKTAVFAYIENALKGEHKNALNALLEKAFKAADECNDNENKQCYLTGMKDTIQLFLYLFKNEILDN